MILRVSGGDGNVQVYRPRLVAAGLDWGGVGGDPLAIEVGAKTDGGVWVNFWELYTQQITHPDLLRTLHQIRRQFGIERIWCDQSQPHAVGFLQSHGLPALANQVRDVDYGLRTVQGLLAARRFVVDRGRCPNLIKEFGLYAFPQDKSGQTVGGAPIDKHNHALDAIRYYLVGEGETPEEDRRVPLVDQASMYLGEDGRWRDNPRATIARKFAVQRDPQGWWDETESPQQAGVYVEDE
jgi:hypothetical protein